MRPCLKTAHPFLQRYQFNEPIDGGFFAKVQSMRSDFVGAEFKVAFIAQYTAAQKVRQLQIVVRQLQLEIEILGLLRRVEQIFLVGNKSLQVGNTLDQLHCIDLRQWKTNMSLKSPTDQSGKLKAQLIVKKRDRDRHSCLINNRHEQLINDVALFQILRGTYLHRLIGSSRTQRHCGTHLQQVKTIDDHIDFRKQQTARPQFSDRESVKLYSDQVLGWRGNQRFDRFAIGLLTARKFRIVHADVYLDTGVRCNAYVKEKTLRHFNIQVRLQRIR